MSTCTKQCYKKNHWSITTPYSLVSIEMIVLHWEAFQFRSFDACAICHSSTWSGSDLPDQLHSASRTNAVTRIYQLHPISLSPSSRVTGLCHQSEQLCMQRELNPGCWACEDVTLHNHELIHPLVLKLLEVFCTYFNIIFCCTFVWIFYNTECITVAGIQYVQIPFGGGRNSSQLTACQFCWFAETKIEYISVQNIVLRTSRLVLQHQALNKKLEIIPGRANRSLTFPLIFPPTLQLNLSFSFVNFSLIDVK